MFFKQGVVNCLTDKQTKLTLKQFSLSDIKDFILRLHFEGCLDSDVFKCIYRMFTHRQIHLHNLLSLRLEGSSEKRKNFAKAMKVLAFCNNLEQVDFASEKRWTTDISFANIYIFAKDKFLQRKPVNITIMSLYHGVIKEIKSKKRLGYLLETIALSCKEYFFTYTNPHTNIFLLPHFLRAADILSRKYDTSKRPRIYLGDYILPAHDKRYSSYSDVLSAGDIKLYTQAPYQTTNNTLSYMWTLNEQY